MKNISVLTVLLLVAGLIPGEVGARTTFSTLPHRTALFVNLDHPGQGLVQESRGLSLRAGRNDVILNWEGVQLIPNSARIVLPSTEGDLFVKSVSTPPNRPEKIWHIHSDRPRHLEVNLRYRLAGLRRETSYRAWLNPDRATMELREIHTLFNRTGQDFPRSWVGLGFGNWLRQTWSHGETKRLSVYRVKAIPYRKTFIVNERILPSKNTSSDSATRLPMHYRVRNTNAAHLGDKPLAAGPLRLYQREPEGGYHFLGEDRIDHTPVGDTVSLRAGRSRNLRATRNKTRNDRLNVIRNRDGQLVMYDTHEEVEIRLRNFRSDTSAVEVIRRIEGEWEMASRNHPMRKLSNNRIQFRLRVPPRGETLLRFRYYRRHVGKTLR